MVRIAEGEGATSEEGGRQRGVPSRQAPGRPNPLRRGTRHRPKQRHHQLKTLQQPGDRPR